MKYMGSLIVVSSIEASRKFYEKVTGLKVVMDFGENITFEGGFSLQSKASWAGFIDKGENEVLSKSNAFELYLEEDDMDSFLERLNAMEGIEYVHAVKEYPWGQRAIRFYDPDYNMIEVGENMEVVIKRFLKQGMSVAEVSERTMYPTEMIQSLQ